MNIFEKYQIWMSDLFFDEATRSELQRLDIENDIAEIEDRFYKDLEFGTGGMRGIMGAGTNRINKYTIGKATVGLGNYLKATFSGEECLHRGVAIAHDTRNNSNYYANVVADILSNMGIKVLLFEREVPTPELSFAVKNLNCIAGIVITASHNSKEYNGYKVYDENGCQMVPSQIEKVRQYIDKIIDYKQVPFDESTSSLKETIDMTREYVNEVLKQSVLTDSDKKHNIHIVYTPIHGAGNVPIQKALKQDGFDHVYIVEEQEITNGDFPTVKYPNPENPEALELGIKLAEKECADLVIGTDPDGDRMGIAVRTEDDRAKVQYKLLTGNQIGALLVDYVLSHTDLTEKHNPTIINTVVTSELGAKIADKHGCTVFSTLTGFKYIGEKITEFEKSGDFTFVMGYEESFGYLIGTHARDKDATVASVLISEAAAEYKSQGKTLLDRLEELYSEFGYYKDYLETFTLEGKEGIEQMDAIMTNLRHYGSPFPNTIKTLDFISPIELKVGQGYLPTSNIIKYILNDESWVAIRPSGTEPKLKVYYSVKANTEVEATDKLDILRDIVKKQIIK